jgi:hypothetical protein
VTDAAAETFKGSGSGGDWRKQAQKRITRNNEYDMGPGSLLRRKERNLRSPSDWFW